MKKRYLIIEEESIIGKKYCPGDNSYCVNLTITYTEEEVRSLCFDIWSKYNPNKYTINQCEEFHIWFNDNKKK